MTYWFTSDLHFGHSNIIDFCDRPWDTVEGMNQGLVDRWNDVVRDGDYVHVLGDFCWGNPSKYVFWLEQLNGRIMLTPGNHDTVWPHLKGTAGATTLRNLGVIVKDCQWQFWLDGTNQVDVCHFPYENDNRHDRMYVDHLAVNSGRPLLHGHIHQDWKVKSSPPGRQLLQINVGVDVWDWTPVSEGQLLELI